MAAYAESSETMSDPANSSTNSATNPSALAAATSQLSLANNASSSGNPPAVATVKQIVTQVNVPVASETNVSSDFPRAGGSSALTGPNFASAGSQAGATSHFSATNGAVNSLNSSQDAANSSSATGTPNSAQNLGKSGNPLGMASSTSHLPSLAPPPVASASPVAPSVAPLAHSSRTHLGSSAAAPPAILRRKLTSFVGFSNLPQQWHQKSLRQGFDLNLLVVGDSGLGKSTLLNTLFEVAVHDLDAPQRYDGSTIGIQTTKIELEESGVRLRLQVIDTPGYGDHINNLDAWKPIVDEIDHRFEQFLEAEEALDVDGTRADPRVHACLFFVEPTGHSLKPLDVVVLKKLHRKVNIVPIIAKADLMTDEELSSFKQAVLADVRAQGIEIFEPRIHPQDDDESVAEISELLNKIPFAVVGSTQTATTAEGRHVLGREYPWGVVEVHNEEHNDFVKLRSLLIRNHMEDLRVRTEQLYESFRTEKLTQLGIKQDDSVFDQLDPQVRHEEERRQHEQQLQKMEQEMRTVFHDKVTEKEQKLKNSERELYEKHKEIKEQLDKQHAELEHRKQLLLQQLDAKNRNKMMR